MAFSLKLNLCVETRISPQILYHYNYHCTTTVTVIECMVVNCNTIHMDVIVGNVEEKCKIKDNF